MYSLKGTSQVALAVKNPPANARDLIRDVNSIRGWGRSPGGGNVNPLQSSCLENPMDRGAQQATVRGVAMSWTRLSDLECMHTLMKGFFTKPLPAVRRCTRPWHHIDRQQGSVAPFLWLTFQLGESVTLPSPREMQTCAVMHAEEIPDGSKNLDLRREYSSHKSKGKHGWITLFSYRGLSNHNRKSQSWKGKKKMDHTNYIKF